MIIVMMVIIIGHLDKLTAIRRMKTKKKMCCIQVSSQKLPAVVITTSMLFSGEAKN